MINWCIENWFIIVSVVAIGAVVGLHITKFVHLPTAKQIENLKEWLLLAVTEAEKELGSGTGQLKLRQVYDWAVATFSWVQFIPFATFSGWVDEALETMREMLDSNHDIKTYVEGC